VKIVREKLLKYGADVNHPWRMTKGLTALLGARVAQVSGGASGVLPASSVGSLNFEMHW